MHSSNIEKSNSNSSAKSKKKFKSNSSLKTNGVPSENQLSKRPPFRSGRIQEENQKFFSIPENETKNSKREDLLSSSTNNSSNSNFPSRSSKAKSKKSSFSQHSHKSKVKSKNISNDNQNMNSNNSIFQSSKLLKQPVQSKKYNLDFDSRWEYFLELKTLDDATRRIYNSAFFQLWKTIYQKRYIQRSKQQVSQIESTLDRFNSTHIYDNQSSFSNSYNFSKTNASYNDSSMIFNKKMPMNYSFNSFHDSSEARVEQMQQKYRKKYNNYINDENNKTIQMNRYEHQPHSNTLNNDFESSYREYQNMLRNRNYNNSSNNKNTFTNRNYYDNYINDGIFSNRNYVKYNQYDNKNEMENSNSNNYTQKQIYNKSNNLRNTYINDNVYLKGDEHQNFDYLRSKDFSLKGSASDSIKETLDSKLKEEQIRKEEIIRQSQSYDPSLSKNLIDEIKGRISGQNEKEVALDFASQLDAIAQFNNKLSEYNKARNNSNAEKEEVDESKGDEFLTEEEEITEENRGIQNSQERIVITNDNAKKEEDFHELNDSTDFIKTEKSTPNEETINLLAGIQTQQSTQKNSTFSGFSNNQKSTHNDNPNSQDLNNYNGKDSPNINHENQKRNEALPHIDAPIQKKKAEDKYDKYIEQITNPSKVVTNSFFEDEDEDDDDFVNYLRSQRINFQSNSNYENMNTKNSVNQQTLKQKYNNLNNSTMTLEKLLKQEIPVNSDLCEFGVKKASASRIQSILSKSTIGYNSNSDDSDSDQIDLSGVQFYHVSQAERAKFSYSNSQGMPQDDQLKPDVSKSRYSKQTRDLNSTEVNGTDEEGNDHSGLNSALRNSKNKDDQRSMNQNQEMRKINSRKQSNAANNQDDSQIGTKISHVSSLNSPKNILNMPKSTRMKRSATLNGVSPQFEFNEKQNEQEKEMNNNRKNQKGNEINNQYVKQQTTINNININSKKEQTNETIQNNISNKQSYTIQNNICNKRSNTIQNTNIINQNIINQQTNQKSKTYGKQQSSDIYHNDIDYQVNKVDQARKNRPKIEISQSSVNYQSDETSQSYGQQENGVNQIRKKQQTNQNETSKSNTTFRKIINSSTNSELTEISKRNVLSNEDETSEDFTINSIDHDFSDNQQVTKNGQRRNNIHLDNHEDEIDEEESEIECNLLMRKDNYKRRDLADQFDFDEFMKIEKKANNYDDLQASFPDDLYDDVFTTGSERRKKYLNETKLYSIINFFTVKELGESSKIDAKK